MAIERWGRRFHDVALEMAGALIQGRDQLFGELRPHTAVAQVGGNA